MIRLLALVLLAGLNLAPICQQPAGRPPEQHLPPTTDRLLVCNKADNSVSIFAIADRKEVANIPTGSGPHEVAVSPDGCTAVVSNYGNQKPGHTLTVIDVVAAKLLRTIDLPQSSSAEESSNKKFLRPHGLQFVSNHQVIVTSEAARQLLQVDVGSGTIERTWSSPQKSMHMVAATRDGKCAAASSIVDGNVVFFDLTEHPSHPPTAVAAGDGAEGIAMHATTGETWVGNRNTHTLSILSATSRKHIATLETGDTPFRIRFTDDQKLVLVTCAESGELQIFDADKRELRRSVSMHGDRSEQSSLPLGVVAGPDQRFAYVTCARGEFVAVVDLIRGELIDRMAARKGPDGIAYARPLATGKRDAATKR